MSDGIAVLPLLPVQSDPPRDPQAVLGLFIPSGNSLLHCGLWRWQGRGDLNEQFASLSDLVNGSLLVWHGNRRCVNQQSTNYPRASLLLLFQKYFFLHPQVFPGAKVSLEPPLTPQGVMRNPCNTAEHFSPLFFLGVFS